MDQCKSVNEAQAARMIEGQDNILILSHQKPDGDTLGSAFAMAHALIQKGKTVRVECSDPFTPKFDMMYGTIDLDNQPQFSPTFVLAVDISDTQLLGPKTEKWADRIDLCIDHHPSNTQYARHLLLDDDAPATTQVISRVLDEMNAPFTPLIADCLYTGLVTDTGCFRYSNVRAQTHTLAARLILCGASHWMINKRMFETKTAARMAIERLVMETLEYGYDKKYAHIVISLDAVKSTGATEDDLEGLSTMPRQIEGVEVCATFKEKGPDLYRISMRGGPLINVSTLCQQFGGGGHARAAGCMIAAPLPEAKRLLARAVGAALGYPEDAKGANADA